jgi:hypothetical protein
VKKKKQIVDYPFFGSFPSDRTPKVTKESTYVSLFDVAIPLNYTSEYRELFQVTTCVTRG